MKKFVALLAVATLSISLAACGGQQASNESAPVEQTATEQPAEQTAEQISLADWEGTWDDMSLWLDLPEIQEAYKTKADKDGKTPEEVKEGLVQRRRCDFHGMVIEGNKISFLDNWAAKDGKETQAVEYEFVKQHLIEGDGRTTEWDEFKAVTEGAAYPVLVMMPVHGEETMTHFHLRYGDSAEALINMEEKWYPTFVKPTTTVEQMIAEIAE